jgi:hypothetical protein
MKNATIATAALCAVLVSLTFFPTQTVGQTPAITIRQARLMLETYSGGKKLGNIDLTAVNYFSEIGLGKGIRAIVVSTNYGGGIAIFSPEGSMESSLATGEAESIQVFDLNGDGILEILTDESEGPATGIVIKNFNLYALSGYSIKKVWTGLSYKMEAPWHPDETKIKVHEVENFIRFDEAGTGYVGRMTYLVSTGIPGRYRKIEYIMNGSVVHALTKPMARK